MKNKDESNSKKCSPKKLYTLNLINENSFRRSNGLYHNNLKKIIDKVNN